MLAVAVVAVITCRPHLIQETPLAEQAVAGMAQAMLMVALEVMLLVAVVAVPLLLTDTTAEVAVKEL